MVMLFRVEALVHDAINSSAWASPETWRRKENRKTAKAQKRADNKEKAKDGNESDDTAKSVTFSLGRMGAPVRGGWLGAGGSGGGSSNAAMDTEGDGGIC